MIQRKSRKSVNSAKANFLQRSRTRNFVPVPVKQIILMELRETKMTKEEQEKWQIECMKYTKLKEQEQ